MIGVHRAVALAIVMALLSAAVVAYDAKAWDTSPLGSVVVRHHELCGVDDLPEEGIQGDVPKADQDSRRAEKGYNCGLELLGHTSLGLDSRPESNANMAWAGHCAYIAGFAGVNVAPQSKPNPPAGAGVAVADRQPGTGAEPWRGDLRAGLGGDRAALYLPPAAAQVGDVIGARAGRRAQERGVVR